MCFNRVIGKSRLMCTLLIYYIPGLVRRGKVDYKSNNSKELEILLSTLLLIISSSIFILEFCSSNTQTTPPEKILYDCKT